MRSKEQAPLAADEAIVELYWERDERAIEETDRKYGTYLMTVAYRILQSREDSEECLNDTYLKTWNAIPPSRPSILRSFLSKIMRGTALDRYDERTRKKRVPTELCIPLSEVEALLPDLTEDDEAEARQISLILSEYLDGVNDRSLYMFVSRYFFVMPVREIAERLGVSESTVHKDLAAMREELRERLAEGGILV
ncbi:MAG: sigma-70 family RNA polymerase sigma factor [Clostridia bacterium]|nr:sigma-70 family RNA polymerase sigma factor [Clostridia bacterium]